MYILINVYASDCAAPYIASVQKFNTITIAQKTMELKSKAAYRNCLKIWAETDSTNKGTEPWYESDSRSAHVIGYDYHDLWEIKEI